jgi:hypothetical protein
MADYFAALAARTLRPELSVQPRQRVRWEETAEPMADALGAAERRSADRARPSASDEGEPPRRLRRPSIAETSQAESESLEARPGQQRSKRGAAGDHDDANAATASTPHPTVRTVEPTVQVRLERAAARPGEATSKSPAIAGDRTAATTRASGIERARPLPARLSARERESRPEASIRIHIGRVDVRAVTTAPSGSSPSASRDSKRALMSLDEYVQKRDRGPS